MRRIACLTARQYGLLQCVEVSECRCTAGSGLAESGRFELGATSWRIRVRVRRFSLHFGLSHLAATRSGLMAAFEDDDMHGGSCLDDLGAIPCRVFGRVQRTVRGGGGFGIGFPVRWSRDGRGGSKGRR